MTDPRARVLLGIMLCGCAGAAFLGPQGSGGAPAWRVAGEFFGAALSPAMTTDAGDSLIPIAVAGAWATVKFAVAAMVVALSLAIPLAFLCSERVWRGPGFVTVRTLVAGMRSVHELILAVVLLAALGLTPATAILALAIPSAGTMAKVFAELLDEADQSPSQALSGLGADSFQSVVIGTVPIALPSVIAFAFYRLECALRSSAVLGFFGFPTLGYHIHQAAENLRYAEVWTMLYALIGLMFLAEWWSGAIRRRLEVA